RRPAAGGHDVDVIPAVAGAYERDPLAVRRRLPIGAGIACDAPELLLDVFVDRPCRPSGDVDERGRSPLEVGRCAIDEEVARVEPAPSAEPGATRRRQLR